VVFPFIEEEDRDMKPIFRTKLFRYLISIMWTHQVEKLEH